MRVKNGYDALSPLILSVASQIIIKMPRSGLGISIKNKTVDLFIILVKYETIFLSILSIYLNTVDE